MASTPRGLRDRKKLATRRAIRAAALRMFATEGYSTTTIEQIAETAEVSAMTFYRYFGTKEAVVISVALTSALEEGLQTLIDDRTVGSGGIATDRLAQQVVDLLVAHDDVEDLEDLATRAELIAHTEELIDALWRHSSTWCHVVADHLPAEGLHARAQGRALVGVIIEAFLTWPTLPEFPSRTCLEDSVAQALESITTLSGRQNRHWDSKP